jgi:hypothetical protein
MCPHIFEDSFLCKRDDDARTYICNIFVFLFLCCHSKEFLHGALGNKCKCSKHIFDLF